MYLGDGVYAVFDGYHIVLTKENGYSDINKIFLEGDVMKQLIDYYNRLKDEAKTKRNGRT